MTDHDQSCRFMFLEKIDAVLVINLDENSERWSSMLAQLKRAGLDGKMHRIQAVRGTELHGYLEKPWFTARTGERARIWAGVAGCVLSHARALKYALEHKDWNVILVLEDDAMLKLSKWESLGSQLADFMEKDQTWELIYPGYSTSPLIAGETAWFNIFHCSGVQGTFSMLLHRRSWEKLLKKLPEEKNIWSWIAGNRAMDYWLKSRITPFSPVYYITPALVDHPDGKFSEITGKLTVMPEKSPARQLGEDAWRRKYNRIRRILARGRIRWDGASRYIRTRIRGFSGGRDSVEKPLENWGDAFDQGHSRIK